MRSRATKVWVVLHGGRASAGEEPPDGPEAIQMEDGTAIQLEDGSDLLME